MVDVLNLAGADTSAGDFEAFASGWYPAYLKKMEDKFTKGGEDAKLPGGTPMINCHFAIKEDTVDSDGVKIDGRYVFRQFVIPPAKIAGKPYEHYKSMMGQVAKFFICLGEPEEVVLSDAFDISDRDRFIGREIGVKVKLFNNTYKGEMDNKVDGFKLIGELSEVAAVGGGLT